MNSTAPAFDLHKHLARQIQFSQQTFGPGSRTEGILDHIQRELDEVKAAPDDVSEWIDIIILAFDGAWRSGHSPEDIVAALIAKQTKSHKLSARGICINW